MTQRVGYTKGTSINPAIIIAPHGFDDTNTTIIAETIQSELECTSIINYGWERSDTFDYFKDKANCNSIKHASEDVINQEFLEPIIESYNYYINNGLYPSLFIIHGVHDSIRKTPHAKNLDLIIGTGHGTNKSCDDWSKHFFCKMLSTNLFNVFLGKENGNYAGGKSDNLNQILNHPKYSSYYNENEKCSFQIEIVKTLRANKNIAVQTGLVLADSINAFMLVKNTPTSTFTIIPKDYPTI
jgi:hypothetical protein